MKAREYSVVMDKSDAIVIAIDYDAHYNKSQRNVFYGSLSDCYAYIKLKQAGLL